MTAVLRRSPLPRWSLLPALAVLASVSACSSYDPPFRGDHAAKQYQTDLASCRASSREAVRRKNAATPGQWIMSPIHGPPEVRAAIRSCMEAKGYVLELADGAARTH